MFTLEARRPPYLLNNYRLLDQLDQQIECPQIIHEHLVDWQIPRLPLKRSHCNQLGNRALDFSTNISFSSSNNQLGIPNICKEFFVYVLFQWCYKVKVLNYIIIQPKYANITLYIKKLKTLCNTINWGNRNSELGKLVVPMSWTRYTFLKCVEIAKDFQILRRNYTNDQFLYFSSFENSNIYLIDYHFNCWSICSFD